VEGHHQHHDHCLVHNRQNDRDQEEDLTRAGEVETGRGNHPQLVIPFLGALLDNHSLGDRTRSSSFGKPLGGHVFLDNQVLVYKIRVCNLDILFCALWDGHTDTHHQTHSNRISRTTNTPAFDAGCIHVRTRNSLPSCRGPAANACTQWIAALVHEGQKVVREGAGNSEEMQRCDGAGNFVAQGDSLRERGPLDIFARL